MVAKSDADWQKINEKLKQLKAKPNCSGNSVIKAFVPCENGFFQVDFYRAKPSTFGTKIFLDFGQSFTFGSEFFASWLQPRGVNGLGDYFEFNLLPKISGLYSKEMLSSTDLHYAEPEVDAVFLSHAHFDHSIPAAYGFII